MSEPTGYPQAEDGATWVDDLRRDGRDPFVIPVPRVDHPDLVAAVLRMRAKGSFLHIPTSGMIEP